MGVFACKYPDAGRGAQPRGADDPVAAQESLRAGRGRRRHRYLIAFCLWASAAPAETYRIATYAAPLSRDGPGLLLRDIRKGDDPEIAAITVVIAHIAPDVLVLTNFDYDLDGLALSAYAETLPVPYPYHFSTAPNAGLPSGHDLDGNGYLGDARDAYGYGRFAGDGGLAVLSRFPIATETMQDFTGLLWRDLPGATLPVRGDAPFPSAAAQEVMRLSSTAHWIVPVLLPDGPPLHVMAYSATPPVFDGPEDANGLRNRDELRLWEAVLDGTLGTAPADFVIAGNTNLDPLAGDGLRQAMMDFLADPRLQDPLPEQPTADWGAEGPGKLRVSYVLPSRSWEVVDAGVLWPAPEHPDAYLLGSDGTAAGPHHLVWVDIRR